MSDKTPVIEVKGLQNCFGKHWVHKDVNLTVNQGEILAIVGGSGSGKTTLVRSILRLMRPTAGEIRVFGVDMMQASTQQLIAVRQRIGMMFQHGALFSGLTVLENIMLPLQEYTQLAKPVIARVAMLKLGLVGLPAEAADRYPSELSGGMIKRAAIARALALDPELVFLDEPTAGLDPDSANGIDELVLELKKTIGLTIVMVTHDLDTLWRVTDRIAFIGEGKVLQLAPIAELAQSAIPEIHDYFTGPRGRAAQQAGGVA